MVSLTARQRDALFGRPYVERDGLLHPDPHWQEKHLVHVRFRGIDYRCHVRVREPFRALIDAWDRAKVLRHVLTLDRFWEWDTCVMGTRMKRHCHGNAFDVNAKWNPIGRPAYTGEGGTAPLLEVARAEGWACAADRGPVARHFELARLPAP